MLKFIKYNYKSDLESFFQKINILKECWIIPDLRTKNELQEKLLNSNGFYVKTSILRIQDFWKEIFSSAYPDFKIISKEFAQAYLRKVMTQYAKDLGIEVIDPERQLASMSYFSSMILDENFSLDEDRIKDWLSQTVQREQNLKPIILINKLLSQFFLHEKMIPSDWITSLLRSRVNNGFIDEDMNAKFMDKDIFHFDLGPEISMLESELIVQISKIKHVYVYKAEYPFIDHYTYLLKPYEYIESYCDKKNKIVFDFKKNEVTAGVYLKKFSNQISETRDAVAQCRKWIEQGVNLEEIQILAPEIETYWPMLRPLLQIEEINYRKDHVVKLNEIQDVALFLSGIAFFSKKINSSFLEKIIYQRSKSKTIEYEKFKEIFASPFLEKVEFLELVESIFPSFFENELQIPKDKIIKNELCHREYFIELCQPWIEKTLESENLDILIKEFYKSTQSNILLNLNDWANLILFIAAKLEKKISMNSAGIKVDSLMSANSFQVKYAYVVGLEDSLFNSSFKEVIARDDIYLLNQEIGYQLEHPDFNFRSYELESLIYRAEKEIYLSLPHHHISGELNNPSVGWQKVAFSQNILEKEIDLNLIPRWQDWMQTPSETIFHLMQESFKNNSYQRDENTELNSTLDEFKTDFLNGNKLFSLSPSSIKSFIDCRYKFFMEKILNLNIKETEDFDIGAKEKGLWYHSMFQRIINNESEFITPFLDEYKKLYSTKVNLNIQKSEEIENQIYLLLDEKMSSEKPEILTLAIWNKTKKKWLFSLVQFVIHELFLKVNFPFLITIGCEVRWSVFFDFNSMEWTKNKPEQGFVLNGSIDRIILNKDTQKAWVIDYKLGSSQALNVNKWKEEQSLQLLFYAWAVEKGWVPDIQHDVELSNFWIMNKWEDKKGFVVEDGSHSKDKMHYSQMMSKTALLSPAMKTDLFSDFEQKLKEIILEFQEYKFFPNPRVDKICSYCDWRTACRLPKLN